jgi:hypothetical protein
MIRVASNKFILKRKSWVYYGWDENFGVKWPWITHK